MWFKKCYLTHFAAAARMCCVCICGGEVNIIDTFHVYCYATLKMIEFGCLDTNQEKNSPPPKQYLVDTKLAVITALSCEL